MKSIIIVMLAVQVAVFLATAVTVLTGRVQAGRRPIWSNFTIVLVIVSGASWNIAESHAGQPGADILMYTAPLLLGMGLMAALLLFRQRRGLDRVE